MPLFAIACNRAVTEFERPATPPVRIVAGSVLAAETLLAIAPRERIAAVHTLAKDTRYSLVAADLTAVPAVGAEPEQLLSARPDLVIIDAFTGAETVAILESAGVPVLRTANPTNFDVILDNIRLIGDACHLESAATALVARTEARLDALAERGQDLGGFALMSLDGAFHTYGRDSLFDAVVRAAGARNLAAEKGAGPFRKLSLEAVLAWRPEVLVLGSAADVRTTPVNEAPAWLTQSAGLALLPAVQRDRLLFVPSAMLADTSHHAVDAVAHIQAQLLEWGPR